MKEFQVNKYLTLRLENEDTIIYVAGQRFRQCKYLLLNIQIDDIQLLDEIESIEEAAERLDKSQEGEGLKEIEIPPEIEFWGHCSNLQVWYENGYDTRILHSNLAFPLLKKLIEVGDPLAKEVFRREIIERYRNGIEATKKFLRIEGFLAYLTTDERLNLLLNHDDFNTLMELSEEIEIDNPLPTIEVLLECIKIKNKRIVELDLSKLGLKEFPTALLNLKYLKSLNISSNNLGLIPRKINRLKLLQKLWLSYNKLLFLPDSICSLKSLEQLWLDDNKIRWLPEMIGGLKNLHILSAHNNRLRRLPKTFYNLKKLQNLNLTTNRLRKLPEKFSELKSLEKLSLENNKNLNISLEMIMELKLLKEISMHLKKNTNLPLNLEKKLKEKGVNVILP